MRPSISPNAGGFAPRCAAWTVGKEAMWKFRLLTFTHSGSMKAQVVEETGALSGHSREWMWVARWPKEERIGSGILDAGGLRVLGIQEGLIGC